MSNFNENISLELTKSLIAAGSLTDLDQVKKAYIYFLEMTNEIHPDAYLTAGLKKIREKNLPQ